MNDNFGEMFRSLFGLPRRERFPDHSFPDKADPDVQDGFPGRGQFFFFHPPFFGGMNPGINDNQEDMEGFHGNGNTRDPFGFGMDIFGHIQQIFEGLGIQDAPGNGEGSSIGPPRRRDDSDSLRDNMLKEPDSDQSQHKQHPFFGDIFRVPDINVPDMYQSPGPQTRTDSDLDEEVRRGNLDAIFGPDRRTRPSPGMIVPSPHPGGALKPSPGGRPYQAFKSVSVHTYRNADGHIEERKTTQDGRGNEETVTTRSVGGQRHTVTKRRDHTGSEQVTEKFDNMDESEKDNFDSKWNSRRSPEGGLHSRMPHSNGLDPDTENIFRNLFGKSFPGFGGDSS